ncbi:MAG TPA: protein-disulfide reductase DsbD domain-containing protein [Rhizomicrobium sp.]|nr:protein-disulfide reductase DsbD domain-containing protein [Rhizomicrobium sp.]
MKKLFLLLSLLFSAPAFGQDQGAKVVARLVAEQGAVAPGGVVTVALEEVIAPQWHTYWKNPGDAGSPTQVTWSLPPGWTAGDIQWPRPKRLPVGPLMDYGYEGKVWLLTKLTAPTDAKLGEAVTIRAAASWLVCKNICVPEEAALTLNLVVAPSSDSKSGKADAAVAKDFAATRALLPIASPWKFNYALGQNLDLYVAAPSLAAAHPTSADFFPGRTGLIKNAAPQVVGYARDGLVLRLTPGAKVSGLLEGVLVLTSSDGSVQALEVSAPPGPVPAAEFTAASASGDLTLWFAILFALIGGLILNVMPCVLPILAMKALSLANYGKEGHGDKGRGESFAYSLGAILSFAVFGLAILLLRDAGTSVGWGFQLQSPIAVAGFALLVFAVGLNLSGLFEVGSVTAGETLTQKSGLTGAFFTGVLAVAVAAPCTAPFMAGALGFALTQNFATALAVFVALGVGFALPFLLLGVWPKALAFMPRPGAWMLTFKQFLAFPMYGAAAWLVWVLAQEAGPKGVIVALAAMVGLALAAWTWSITRNASSRGRGIGAVVAILVLLASLYTISQLKGAQAAAPVATTKGEAYTAAKLASLRAANKPVFVDATAAWCITCLVNEDAVLSKDSIKSAFASKGVTYMVADWTNQNPEITALLKENGRSGVPMYLYYAPGAATPIILPQILTEADVIKAMGG